MSSKPISPQAAGPDKRWFAQLAQARDEAQLLNICRRYVASIRYARSGGLPLACRPIPLEDATDLSAYALQLVRFRCETENPPPLVVRMAAFFVHANVRMAQILWQMNDGSEADRILARLGPQRRERNPGTPGDPDPRASPG